MITNKSYYKTPKPVCVPFFLNKQFDFNRCWYTALETYE